MFRFTKMAVAITVLTTAGLGAFAYASKGVENDAMSIVNAKVSMSQAVSVAEQHANGKASRAEYEKTKSGWTYDVEVVSGVKVYDVSVNAENGTVITSTEDKTDHDDDNDKED